jgi:hypothetical protein
MSFTLEAAKNFQKDRSSFCPLLQRDIKKNQQFNKILQYSAFIEKIVETNISF